MKNSICIIGHFAFGHTLLDGQTVKTKTLTRYLTDTGYFSSILNIDTFNWKKKPFQLTLQIQKSLVNYSEIVFLPSHNGRRVFFPIFYFFGFFRKINFHHIVIGSSLEEQIAKRKYWIRFLNSFYANYVETESMSKGLKKLGINNTIVLSNFKQLNILTQNQLPHVYKEPFALCTFSRVMKEKGIEDAIAAVNRINKNNGKIVFTLDIYGQIEKSYSERFSTILKEFPDYVRYRGMIPYHESVEVLKNYFLLLFPTFWDSEGFAGTIIDAFAAGLPIIASDWKYNSEIIQDHYTGRIIPVHDMESLIYILLEFAKKPDDVIRMKPNCLSEAEKYSPERVIKPLLERL
jgi:glycosyltransferase involved in cell wall biosynthesis